jgi:hypothetical protein
MEPPRNATRTIAGVEIFSPVMGQFFRREDSIYPLVERTDSVPNVPGRLFGCVFEYINNTGRVVPYRWELVVPGAPGTAATIDGTTTVYRLADENRVVNHTEGLVPGQSAQYSINRIDPGDPPGRWTMELFVGGELLDTLTFFIYSVT